MAQRQEQLDTRSPESVLAVARDLLASVKTANDESGSPAVSRIARDLQKILDGLRPDPEIRAAALLYPPAEAGLISLDVIGSDCGPDIQRLVTEMVKLGSFGLPAQWRPDRPLPAAQAETLRKMLLAIVADVRLVTVRLAEQLRRMRAAKRAPESVRHRVAMETRLIFAPLANRLGIWHLKWELEDLAFRFLDYATYRDIAAALRERRQERERRVSAVIDYLQRELESVGIDAEVQGRSKHIYSIWRKMQRKRVGLEEIFDISAVRVLVDSIKDCYTVLGIVHAHWPYVPGEFDDYIANPKGNFYRSLHTAVIGPGDQPLEIQIRTREMHEHAELGVAAHWRYKEGGGTDPAFEKKIGWLRQLLEPSEEGETDRDFIDRIQAEIFEDRVYAVTPDGDVIDLPAGSTPLDFAYHVHTQVGHHCRGARVNGRMVPLTYRLENGDKVEIITSEASRPSRDWLIPQRGYLASPRSRSKVRNWFRRMDQDVNQKQGRAMLEKELQRLAETPDLEKLAGEFNFGNVDQLYLAIGAGDVTLASVISTIERTGKPRVPDELPELPESRRRARQKQKESSGIVVSGVGDLMTHMARCCRPVPPERITGYITLGRGVTIHRQECRNLLRLQDSHPERTIEVDWGRPPEAGFPVDIQVEAYDRRGLLRDISTVLTEERTDILESRTRTDTTKNIARIELTLSVTSLEQVSRLLHRLNSLPNIFRVGRSS
ncbi:MAG: bifunctional (p)ppGpp synthetase/guanosine-3',5'-bis(diphosphate) 3'-pyrophosphohydrolase [Gammaproteobacteria bacterium]